MSAVAKLQPRKPRMPGRPSLGGHLQGAPLPAKPFTFTEEEMHPERVQPRWFTGSDLEWLAYDWFVHVKKWLVFGADDPNGPQSSEGVDVLWQYHIPAPGYKSGKFRGDIWLVPQGRAGSPGYPYRRGIVLDPENPWTHKDTSVDRQRRDALAAAEFLLVWVDGYDLQNRRDYVMELAIKGKDVSSIYRNAR